MGGILQHSHDDPTLKTGLNQNQFDHESNKKAYNYTVTAWHDTINLSVCIAS
jgi:hypothetical protein